ncbi:transferase 1, rSAM/selenodomain-associated/transferase 2, rSAM/selenodomain-associated [Dehalogenimonas formicexedens]|uniref:4,4'-diaponeurosporenoate glycosyltransferase n=1 Tax=Dehalogenimonas formicexedens TaxID=1839801 RepID=A0A1P8F6K0_9CHLR|nr:TIGR04283 family arsenosugar biosynthesis glycosyltransferase [Dehalogenimonas formicexedens]APV43972.1 transferase 1, rSAM/selenodomain-associated/transferase 2, rSAM/selenodomain-associated [Dehalogenimonas formicexedens]
MTLFSVIIPTLNEQSIIGQCIDGVRKLGPDVEIIVADSGSTDSTTEIARGRGAKVISSSPGRGGQMNAGAAVAGGDILVFLHADTFLPEGAFARLAAFFRDPQTEIGVFHLKFDSRHWLLKLLERLSGVRPYWFRFGDSSITVRRTVFMELGGFPDQPLFEDLEFLRKANRKTRVILFPLYVTTSARRFTHTGICRQTFRNILLTLHYLAGAAPKGLSLAYERTSDRASKCFLMMMVRYPEPGKVKSRLASGVGEKSAAKIYRFCAESLFGAAAALPDAIARYLYCAEASDCGRISSWAGGRFESLAQPEGDLAVRLTAGFDMAFAKSAAMVVIIASDIPDLRPRHIKTAFAALEEKDVVLGPSPDGGFYLIGLKRSSPFLFKNIAWSSSSVLAQMQGNIRAAGLSVEILPELLDIDTLEDWIMWKAGRDGNNRQPEIGDTFGHDYAAA